MTCAVSSARATRFSCRSSRIRSARRVRGSRRSSRCPRAISCTCRAAAASAFRRASRTKAERQRLKEADRGLHAPPDRHGGYIVRTAAQGAPVEGLREDMAYLDKLWQHVRVGRRSAPPAAIVHEDLPLALRVLRDELARGERTRAGRFTAGACAHARVRRRVHGRTPRRASSCMAGRGRSSICTASRRRSPRARSQGAAQVGRPPGDRPDRGDGDDRRQHGRLRRPSQSRGDHLPHQPRGGGRDRAPTAAAQSRRHHHHRLHRHEG